jgi:serine/threonine protein kinase
MAPEMYDDGNYTFAVDVYSFSPILFELLVREPVFSPTLTAAKVMKRVLSNERPLIPNEVPPIIRKIIKRGWAVDPEVRDEFNDILVLLSHDTLLH